MPMLQFFSCNCKHQWYEYISAKVFASTLTSTCWKAEIAPLTLCLQKVTHMRTHSTHMHTHRGTDAKNAHWLFQNVKHVFWIGSECGGASQVSRHAMRYHAVVSCAEL